VPFLIGQYVIRPWPSDDCRAPKPPLLETGRENQAVALIPFAFHFLPRDNSNISAQGTTRSSSADSAAPTRSARTDDRLGHIIRVLSSNATIVISGTKLAQEIGTTRSEIWRLVQQLRSLGLDIAGHPATGYQLVKVPDLPVPDVLASPLSATIFAGKVHHYFRIPSTNSEAMQAASAGAPEGSVFLGEEQTAGRGRGGHSWTSPPSSGIYCSVVLRPTVAPADAIVLSMMAGLATAFAVEQVTGVKPDLRWPNDLLIGEKKFCGILTEMNAEITRVRYAVIGVGINVNQSEFPGDLQRIATSLRIAAGRPWSRVQLTAALLQSLDREYCSLTSRNIADTRADIFRRFEQQSSYARGKRVQVEEDGGYEGITAGLDERGFLLVETATGLRTVLSGGVRPA
jgi:BirA family biotin operon repressor/biotin-[acetyl-CoA-carboxylase] ligase